MTAPTLFDTEAPAATTATGPRPLVIGLDMALGTSGVAGPGWTDTIRTGDLRGEERLVYITESAASFYRRADLVLIEGAAFSTATQVGHDELSALRWMIRCDLYRRAIPFAVVTPHGRTIYATGKARWKDENGKQLTAKQVKGLVRDAVATLWGINCTGTTRYDQADAYVLQEMGQDWLGYPAATLPQTHRRALDGVQWPIETVAVAR